MRYMIEGTWSGYNSSQRRVVHREFTTSTKRAEQVKSLGWIRYTDGTTLTLTVTSVIGRSSDLKPIEGYSSLIAKCIQQKVNSVEAIKND